MLKKSGVVIFLLVFLFLMLVLYPLMLNTTFPTRRLKFFEGFVDSTFLTTYYGLSFEEKFNLSEWSINWILAPQRCEKPGFNVSNEGLILFATFTGFNPNHDRGVTGIEIKRSLIINTNISSFMVIRIKASSSDSSLMFSFAVIDYEGNWHGGPWYHVSTDQMEISYDLRKIFLGNVKYLAIRFTNDYNPYFDGGKQYIIIQKIAIYKFPPDWILATNKPVKAEISSDEGILKISASGNIPAGTIVSAQRIKEIPIDLDIYQYFIVRIRTSSINAAARVMIWTNQTYARAVLLKTYNDFEWHTEIVYLPYYGISGVQIYMIELGFEQVQDAENSESTIWYGGLSFCKLNES